MPLGLHTAELNFETIKEIGQEGKNSQVYISHDKQLDTEIVVKKIKKSKINNAEEYYEEAKKLNASHHTNVVKVSYGCSDSEHIYIAMPYYKNGSLKTLINKRFLTVKEIIRYSIHFLSGLHHIHSKGLIHCDIKPDNILLSDSNEALLSDFGLAKFMNENGCANQKSVYFKQAPPEAFESFDKTIHYDIYLAGLTIYRLLNGDEHFNYQFEKYTPLNEKLDDYKTAIKIGDFPSRNDYLPHIPSKIRKVVNKALSVDIKDRHQSVLELINELSTIDKGIDWIYTFNDSIQRWSKLSNGCTIEIELTYCESSGNYNIITTKTKKTTQKVTEHCHNNIANYDSLLNKALKL